MYPMLRTWVNVGLVFLFCVGRIAAQENPPDVKFEVRLAGGKTLFRQGERIAMELAFSSTSPDTYTVSTRTYDRSGRLNADQFVMLPSTGHTDPLSDYFGTLGIGPGGGLSGIGVLKQEPIIVPLELNEWFRFDVPGSYRLRIVASRVSRMPQSEKEDLQPVSLRLTSNEVTFQIVAADPAWQAQVLQESLAIVDRATAENYYDPERRAACRTIRFLGTPAAVREMVRRLGNSDPCTFEWMAGLFGSSHRKLVLSELEEQFASPWQPVTSSFLLCLSRLAFLKDYPEPLPPWPGNDSEKQDEIRELYRKRNEAMQAVYEGYVRKLWEVFPLKRDPARAVTLHALFELGVSGQSKAASAVRPQLAAMMGSVLVALSPEVLEGILGYRWKYFASLSLLPALRQIFEQPPGADSRGSLRGLAALRILQASPAEGRSLLLAEIKRLEPRIPIGFLRALPDDTIEELDEIITTHLEQSRERELSLAYTTHCGLLERYATARILDRVKKVYADPEKRWDVGKAELLAYFLRVDPSYGLQEITTEAAKPCEECYRQTLSSIARLHMSPTLEGLALEFLGHPSAGIAADAAETLGKYGSVAAKEALMKRLEQWHKTWNGRHNELRWVPGKRNPNEGVQRLGEVLRGALLSARSWLLSPEEIELVGAFCITESCRQQVAYRHEDPYSVHINGSETEGQETWSAGQVYLNSWADLLQKLAQYPPGSRWTWAAGQWLPEEEKRKRLNEIEQLAAVRGAELTVIN